MADEGFVGHPPLLWDSTTANGMAFRGKYTLFIRIWRSILPRLLDCNEYLLYSMHV
jgi:hypothetical protein